MFRLIRVIILVILAFVVGIIWGDLDRRTTCDATGGNWRDKTCFMTE